ncbi:MAG: NnrU family protein [Emcibacteraceae bacterium]|nr:NnrU family protein [Emcibacteraceae bacterium]
MDMLLAGILLWSAVHYVPSLMPNIKIKMIELLGNSYRAVFSLLIIASIALMVMGWKATIPEFIYQPPEFGPILTSVSMIIAFYLMGSSHGKANIKRFLRHPMLCGIIFWAGGHLLSNGDKRSIILFGGMIIWAVVEIIAINKRDGPREKPEPASIIIDIRKFAVAVVLYFIVAYAHPYFTGVEVMRL